MTNRRHRSGAGKIDMFQYLDLYNGREGINHLMGIGLLPKAAECKVCLSDERVTIQNNSRSKDGVCFRCTLCKSTTSIREGSFFSGSHLTLREIVSIVLCFVMESSSCSASCLLRINKNVVLDWYNFCRDVAVETLSMHTMVIGGPGMHVQIDESLLMKRKYNRGRLVKSQWVFGAYCVEQSKGFLFFVENRSEETLLPLITRHIADGSIITSDLWKGYYNINKFGFEHRTVNHSRNFVDPITAADTNSIEGFWSVIKRKLKYIFGSQGELKQRHLQEFVYRHNFGFNGM